MLDNRDYISRLNKARRRRNRRFDVSHLIIGLIVLAVIALLVGAGLFIAQKREPASSDSPKTVQEGQTAEESSAEEITISPEEAAEAERLAEAEKVVGAYQNLGIVQVSGTEPVRRLGGD